jgi:hypothetical protein
LAHTCKLRGSSEYMLVRVEKSHQYVQLTEVQIDEPLREKALRDCSDPPADVTRVNQNARRGERM